MRNFAALLLVAAGAANAPSTEEFLVALVGVDPVTKGPTAYSKTPAGTGLPAHSHSFAEYTVIIAGKGTLKVAGKSYEAAPGSYFVIPAAVVHEFTCGAGGDCLLLTRRSGPADY